MVFLNSRRATMGPRSALAESRTTSPRRVPTPPSVSSTFSVAEHLSLLCRSRADGVSHSNSSVRTTARRGWTRANESLRGLHRSRSLRHRSSIQRCLGHGLLFPEGESLPRQTTVSIALNTSVSDYFIRERERER